MTTTLIGPPEPQGPRWTPLRAGIQNIWEYDDQRFLFHGGRLLLRGQNAVGKTKVIELLMPFLLDADLSPRRLDPFGSGSRHMYWNLINEGNPEVKIAIGYVWLELGRAEQDACYLTIGAGLRAKRASGEVEAWFFITDQRVDHELQLLRERTPLTRTQLEEAIGERGAVFDRRADYRQAVNRRLFGLEQRQYDALVETLLELRRPQLSKQLQPSELSRILTASLPPLDSAVVDPLSEGFERLDADRDAREDLARTEKTVSGFLQEYRAYAAVVGKSSAQRLTQADSAFHTARARLRKAEQELEQAEQAVAQHETRLQQLTREQEELEIRRVELRSTDAYRAVQQLAEAEQAEHIAAKQARRAREQDQHARGTLARREQRLEQQQQEAARLADQLQRESIRAEELARQAALASAHGQICRLIGEDQPDAAQGLADTALQQRRQMVAELRSEGARVADARRQHELAQQALETLQGRLREQEQALVEAEDELETARQAREQALLDWHAALRVLAVEETELPGLLELEDDRALQRQVAQLAAVHRSRLDGRRQEFVGAATRVGREIEEAEQDRARIEAAPYTPPDRPAWREERPAGRPGSPLYLLCDFDEAVGLAERAGIEAALEAAGLLDAWVTPEGDLLAPGTRDVVLRADPIHGPTLADLLRPAPRADDVPLETIARVLRTVGVAQEAVEEGPACWIATDGRWRLGPLHGAASKPWPEHIGETAREQARARRLERLDLALERLRAERDVIARQAAEVEEALERLDQEVQTVPSAHPVQIGREQVRAAQEAVAQLRPELYEAAERAEERSGELNSAVARRDALASRHDLLPWVARLDELSDLGSAYERGLLQLLHLAREARRARTDQEERQEELGKAAETARAAEQAATEADLQATRAGARTRALRDAAGAAPRQVIEEVEQADQAFEQTRQSKRVEREKLGNSKEQLGSARTAAATAAGAVEEREGARACAVFEVRQLGATGLLALLAPELDCADDPAGWSLTEALVVARQVDAATANVACTDEARDRQENRLAERERRLQAELLGELRVFPRRTGGVVTYQASRDGRSLTLAALAGELQRELLERERLMDRRERDLIQEFLSGQAGDHLRARLHDARGLVDKMNEQLAGAPSSSGMQLRLRWEVADDAPTGGREAIDLMLRSGRLRSEADNDALARFLKQRLEEARIGEEVGSLRERMQRELDYRGWFRFQVEFRSGDERWRALTRKAHGAGSGGQKAVQLHLPLFAAAAAFYASADEHAPRLIVLDEAFAGIDHATRGTLMGLLEALELDFIVTSYDEWGCYAELHGLSIYHLRREPGCRGVYCERFLWDGEQRHELGAA